MLRTLLDGDISLHMLSDHRYEIKNPNKNTKSRKVFGMLSKLNQCTVKLIFLISTAITN